MQQIFKSTFCVSFAIFICFYLLSVVISTPIDAYKISSSKDLTQKTEGSENDRTSLEDAASELSTDKSDESEIDDLEVEDFLLFQVPKFCKPGHVFDEKGRCRKKLAGSRKLSLN